MEPVKVSPTEDGIRIARWFARHYPRLSIGEFRKLCRTGQIRINAGRVRGNEILHAGDMVRIPPAAAAAAKTEVKEPRPESGGKFSMADLEKLRKRIIHDDEDIVAFDKPAGLAVQGGTGIKKSLDKMAAALFPHDNILLVHRLDRETSGVIVLAKNQRAAQALAAEFQSKAAGKEYLALLSGVPKSKRGVIDNFMTRGRVFDKEEAAAFKAETGLRPQNAVTRYRVLAELSGILAWVRFMPETGRTHQLRLHAAFSIGAPIVGDTLYGQEKEQGGLRAMIESDNLFLFAEQLTFRHPGTGREMTIRAQLPEFMKPILGLLGFDENDQKK
ncbi:MAG: RluA family pseudouridine synthase [Alphaproteobacteria bacterium]|nr:RluA family pseudouridine synthase [Alphaproteobacteria bacterium]